ncbi:MAG: TIM barrel protein, partial [Verrucomicrobiota bacterium]
ELSLYAEQKGVMLGIESNGMQATIDVLLEEVNSPYLKVYYDTGNLLRSGEDVYSVIKDWGAENICQIHLKPFNSEGAIFGNGETDLEKLRKSIEQSGYRDWLVFEAGPGKKTLGVPYAKKNLIGIMRMLGE